MKKAAGLLLCFSFCWASASFGGETDVPGYAVFPSDWLKGASSVFPITNAPADVQWEAWVAVKAMSRAKKGRPIWIESFGGDLKSAEKLRDYFVEHHHFPAKRFKLSASARPGWEGWVVVHAAGEPLPLKPRPPAPPAETPVVTTQAAPTPPAAPAEVSTKRERPRKKGWKGNVGPELRPMASVQWFSADRAAANARVRASWLGARVGFDTAIAQFPVLETGLTGHFFRSMMNASPDAREARVADGDLSAYVQLKANTTVFGVPMLRLIGGYSANVRSSKTGLPFLSAMRGFRSAFEASTFVDNTFTLGFTGGYVFAGDQRSVIEAGGFLSQRLSFFDEFGSWDARLGVQVAAARDRSSGVLQQESWAAFSAGLIGYFY